jgi:hypothetical protein
MSTPTPTELRDLLLHRLPEAHAKRIEEQLMQDADVAEALRMEETDLIDDYVAERLTAVERGAVEKHLLVTPAALHRLKIARALQEISVGRKQEEVAKPRVAAWNRWPIRAAAAFVICVFAVSVLMKASRQDEQNAPPVLPEPTPSAAGPTDPALSEPFNVVLLADLTRGVDQSRVDIKPTRKILRFQVETENADLALLYRLRVLDSHDDQLYIAKNLTARESGGYLFVETNVPADILGTGPRKVVLEPVADGAAPSIWQVELYAPR